MKKIFTITIALSLILFMLTGTVYDFLNPATINLTINFDMGKEKEPSIHRSNGVETLGAIRSISHNRISLSTDLLKNLFDSLNFQSNGPYPFCKTTNRLHTIARQ